MKRNKRKKSRTEMLGMLSTAPVRRVESPYVNRWSTTGLQQFTAEEKDKREAGIRAAITEQNRLISALIQEDIIAGLDVPSKFLEVTTAQIGDGAKFIGVSPEAVSASIRRALSEAEDQMGTLSDSDKVKMARVAQVNIGCDLTESTTWIQISILLRQAGELDIEPEQPTQPEQSEEFTFDELLDKHDTSSRAGRKAIGRAIVTEMQGEALVWYKAFADSLAKNFNYLFSDIETQAVVGVMKKRNYNFTNAKDWDRARLVCVANGTLPSTLLYPDEKLAAVIADDATDTRSYEGKQKLRQLEQQIMNR